MIPALCIGPLHPIQWAALALLAALLVAIVAIWRASRPAHEQCQQHGHKWDFKIETLDTETRCCLRCGETEEWVADASGWSGGYWEQRGKR